MPLIVLGAVSAHSCELAEAKRGDYSHVANSADERTKAQANIGDDVEHACQFVFQDELSGGKMCAWICMFVYVCVSSIFVTIINKKVIL